MRHEFTFTADEVARLLLAEVMRRTGKAVVGSGVQCQWNTTPTACADGNTIRLSVPEAGLVDWEDARGK